MTLPKPKQPAPSQRYMRNRALARYFGVSEVTLRRWKHDPALKTPQPMVINDIEYNDLILWDRWLQGRAISRLEENSAA